MWRSGSRGSRTTSLPSRGRLSGALPEGGTATCSVEILRVIATGVDRAPVSLFDHPLRIPGDLPQVSVRVLEVAGVTAPEGVTRRLYDDGTRGHRLVHHRIDFGLGSDVVPDAELRRARAAGRNPRVMGNALPRPERKLQPCLEIEERHCPIFELRADDSLRLEAEAVAVEADGPVQVVDAKSDERYPGLHPNALGFPGGDHAFLCQHRNRLSDVEDIALIKAPLSKPGNS